MRAVAITMLIASLCSCSPDASPGPSPDASTGPDSGIRQAVERALDDAIARTAHLADSIDDLLQPVPLLTPAQESGLRRFGNDAQLARARELGARPADESALATLRADGRLVELEDSTPLWAVRELDHSLPLVTPDAVVMLTRIAEEFQRRITDMGLPPFRIEITSALRTADSQSELRQTNVNAAAGTSTHEFGTTVDIAYSSFAAPYEAAAYLDVQQDTEWLRPRLEWFAHAAMEAAAARKSRELQAILGAVLLELQRAGDVMVTLERQQPVYHLTVARRLGG